jgi:hypothetical protein
MRARRSAKLVGLALAYAAVRGEMEGEAERTTSTEGRA